jgi:hypothetical protein
MSVDCYGPGRRYNSESRTLSDNPKSNSVAHFSDNVSNKVTPKFEYYRCSQEQMKETRRAMERCACVG